MGNKGWCAYAHGEHELEPTKDSFAHQPAPHVIHQPIVWAPAEAAAEPSSKLNKKRMKTRLCQQFVEGGSIDEACSFFVQKGWCAYAHGEHELEPVKDDLPQQRSALPSVAYQQVAMVPTEAAAEPSSKLNKKRMKTRLCQQYIDGLGQDEACSFFVRNGWCAYAHGEHELEAIKDNAADFQQLQPVVEAAVEPSVKINKQKIKSRLCQQFVDGQCVDEACSFFVQHGWCAFAHGEHELGQTAGAAVSSTPGHVLV